MKTTTISLVSLAFITFTMCSTKKEADKTQQNLTQKMEQQNTEKIFISDWNGAEEKPGFKILNNSQELNQALAKLKVNPNTLTTEPINIKTVDLPEKQKAVLYSFGMMRAGVYKAKGIESTKLIGETLEVTLQKNAADLDLMQPREAVVSTPWMIFSIPEELDFKEIIIK